MIAHGVYHSVRYDIEIAKLASQRTAAMVHQKVGRGRSSLAAIATSSLFVGTLGTVLGIVGSFHGVDGEKSALLAALNWSLAEAIYPTLASLLVGLFATWFHSYISNQLDIFDTEMKAATLELANALSLLK